MGEFFALPYLCPEFWLLSLWFAGFVFLQTNNKIRKLFHPIPFLARVLQ